MDAVRHRVTGAKCCPLHGPTLGATEGQPVPVVIKGDEWVLYDSQGDGITTDAVHSPSKNVDGSAFAQTYICGVGNHRVVVYRVINRQPRLGLRPPWPPRPTNRPSWQR